MSPGMREPVASEVGEREPSSREAAAAAALSMAMGNGQWHELWAYEQRRFVRLATACLTGAAEWRAAALPTRAEGDER